VLPNFEVSEQQPNFGEREPLVRNNFKASLVDLARPVDVLRLQFLVDGVVDPQVDIAAPVSLLL